MFHFLTLLSFILMFRVMHSISYLFHDFSTNFVKLHFYLRDPMHETRQEEPLYGVCIITNKLVNDCCLTPTQQFFSHIMARTS
jgi:hypothetical protein